MQEIGTNDTQFESYNIPREFIGNPIDYSATQHLMKEEKKEKKVCYDMKTTVWHKNNENKIIFLAVCYSCKPHKVPFDTVDIHNKILYLVHIHLG